MRLARPFLATPLLAASLGLLAALLPAASARALAFDPNPVPVSHFGGSTVGALELVDVVTGLPAGGQVLYGSVSPTATTIVLRGTVDVGSSSILYLGIRETGSLSNWIAFGGLGTIPGADTDVTSALEGITGTAGFLSSSAVGAGGVFDLVFMSYDVPLASDGSLEFVAALVNAPEEVGVAQLVPEPGTLALMGAGLATLLARERARRRG